MKHWEKRAKVQVIIENYSEYYSFTEEEMDFIINYDIKYRMGKESAEADKLEEE